MGFEVPNTPDVGYIDQSEPDAGDFRALGYRNSGIISGCGVSSSGSSGMSVAAEVGVVSLNGNPYDVAASPALAIANADAATRFDLIGVSLALPTQFSIIKGEASPNARFPVFDPATFVLCAAVQVRGGAASIGTTDVIDKRIFIERSFKRTYDSDVADAIDVGHTVPGGYRTTVKANGTVSWASSVLRRTGEKAMEFATSLVLKAVDTALPVLISKATLDTPAERLLQFISSTNAENAYVDGIGQAFFANFKFGDGPPESVVSALKGALYIDRQAPRNAALWIHEGADNTSVGWVAFRVYSSSESALPTGSILPWSGNPVLGDTVPEGFVIGNGQYLSTVDPLYEALYTLIGTRWGAGAGTFRTPPLSGRMLVGYGGGLIQSVGQLSGPLDGKVALDIENMPSHRHLLSDPGHSHPMYGFPYTWAIEPRQIKPAPANLSPSPAIPYMDIWPANYDISAKTGMTVGYTGGVFTNNDNSKPFSIVGPTAGVAYLIKL